MSEKTEPQLGSEGAGGGELRSLLPHPLDKLTELEIRTMVLVYERNTAKDIARIEGVTPDAVVARINRARSKMGGIGRVAAARQIVAAMPPKAYHLTIPQPIVVAEPQSPDDPTVAGREGADSTQVAQNRWQLPIPTKTRPINDDPRVARIIWPIVVAVFIVMTMAILQAVMVGIDRLRL